METKIKYTEPHIEIVILDNEISLALESTPPLGPDEVFGFNQDNPFKSEYNLG